MRKLIGIVTCVTLILNACSMTDDSHADNLELPYLQDTTCTIRYVKDIDSGGNFIHSLDTLQSYLIKDIYIKSIGVPIKKTVVFIIDSLGCVYCAYIKNTDNSILDKRIVERACKLKWEKGYVNKKAVTYKTQVTLRFEFQ